MSIGPSVRVSIFGNKGAGVHILKARGTPSLGREGSLSEGKEGEKKEKGERKERKEKEAKEERGERKKRIRKIVAKALDGRRYPLPLCEWLWV